MGDIFKGVKYISQDRFVQTWYEQSTFIKWLIRDRCMEGLEEEMVVSIILFGQDV